MLRSGLEFEGAKSLVHTKMGTVGMSLLEGPPLRLSSEGDKFL